MSVSAIIPAHNEAGTVGAIVRAIKAAPSVDEVIVVSDASTDATAVEARAAGADLVIERTESGGKGEALAVGVESARGQILFFCDADLIGFTSDHVENLLHPVLNGTLAMCAGLRDRGPVITRLERYLPYLGGERALLREVFESVSERFRNGYGIEVALNYICRVRRLSYDGVPSWNVRHRPRIKKIGLLPGIVGYVAMIGQVAATMLTLRLNRKSLLYETQKNRV